MKKILLLFLLFLISGSPILAQQDFRAGYIVTLQNDTIRGLINNKGEIKNALECTFKSNSEAEKQVFSPQQLKGYGIVGSNRYESLSAQIIAHPYNEVTSKFEEQDVAGQPDVNFMQILVKGTASLYLLTDVTAAPHYYLKVDQRELKELVFLEANTNNAKTGWKDHQRIQIFTGTLLNEMVACPALRPEIEKTPYKPSALSNLVSSYNTCINPGTQELITVKRKVNFSAGILAGLSTSILPFEANGHFLEKGNYKSKPAFTAGLLLNNSLPFLNDKLSLYNALVLTRRHYTNSIADTLSTVINQYQIRFNYNYLRLETGLQYTFPFPRLKPFLQAGIVNN